MTTRLASKYLPTINLDNGTYLAVVTGNLPIRTGQWIKVRSTGVRGQYITHHDGTIYAACAGKQDGFHGRTQRFCRAVWHHNKKGISPAVAVLAAPTSLSLSALKAAVQVFLGKAEIKAA